MAALKKFWVVRDGGPESELADVLFDTDVNDFVFYIFGVGSHAQFVREHHTIYENEASAKRDADARLAGKRKVQPDALDTLYITYDCTPEMEPGENTFKDTLNFFAAFVLGSMSGHAAVREHIALYTTEAEAKRDADARYKKVRGTGKTAHRVGARYREALLREEAKEDVHPLNPPKGVEKALVRDNGKQDTSAYASDEAVKPASRDVRPQDVFIAKPKDVAVRSLVDTGRDMQHAIDNQVPKDRGYDTVKNLSQYLIETGGGGGTKPVGVKK